MSYLYYTDKERSSYAVCILVTSIRKDEIKKAYIDPFGLDAEHVMVMDLFQSQTSKKTSATAIKNYIKEELVPSLQAMDAKYVLCADADYFKILAKTSKAEPNLGYVMDSEYGDWKVLYVPNYQQIFYDPDKVKTKIAQAMAALESHVDGTYIPPGDSIIHFEAYPKTVPEIKEWLQKLLNMRKPLAIDTENFSLKHDTAGIATISFAWSQHEGIAFAVDYVEEFWSDGTHKYHGKQVRNEEIRSLLRWFFHELDQTTIYHNIAYDVYVLIYQLFMKDILDTDGLLIGMDVMLKQWDDTQLITYLATNSCAGNKLGLKAQSQEFAGNYAMGDNIKDVRRIPLDQLLRYNLVDTLSTNYVYLKNLQKMLIDGQHNIYLNLFKPATRDIIQMQLTGLPISMKRVVEVKGLLEADRNKAVEGIMQSVVVQEYTYRLRERVAAAKNAKWKKKTITPEELETEFNPASHHQLRDLLYDFLGLPVLEYTEAKLPSTKADVLGDLINVAERQNIKDFLQLMRDFSNVQIILSTFIPAMEEASLGPDGWHYMFGKFNLGGTLSGRLSSSEPNLQNLPAGAKGGKKGYYGKLVKSCIQAPPGWVFTGLDFSSLEDRISALTTKDPNKLKVYTDGYDGHSLRAYAYYKEHMPEIDPDSVVSINSIQKKHKVLRDKSKNPTFTLTYQGTWRTLVVKYKFAEDLAKLVEQRYHEVYKVSDDWVAAKLDQASRDGYITAAFGLRVRTPKLHQVIRGTKKTPFEAEAEGRTAGNALGQSWCLLNTRAGIEFNEIVRKSNFRTDIRPCAQIHDAQYHLVREDIAALSFMNDHLVKAVNWQDHDDIRHDQVGLGGEVSIFYPTWADEIVIPNGLEEEGIQAAITKALEEREKDKAA